MTKYLLKELAIAEGEIAKRAPKSGIKASVIELPGPGSNELRLHIEFAVHHAISHGASESEVRIRTAELIDALQGYMQRYAESLDADAAVKR